MKNELFLMGNRYEGRFLGKIKKGKKWTGSEYTEAYVDIEWWCGEGIIKDKEIGEERRFFFETKSKEYNLGSLEHEIVCFDRREPYDIRPKIVNYPAVVDLELEVMYEEAKNREDEEIISTVSPTKLEIEDLVERGLIAEESGQIRILLKINKRGDKNVR